MNKKQKMVAKWVKALRSGKYKQTTGRLQDGKGYCCLGVACAITIPKSKQEKTRNKLKGLDLSGQIHCPKLLKKIVDEFRYKTDADLIQLNDGKYIYNSNFKGTVYKYTFDEIAELLEETFINKRLD